MKKLLCIWLLLLINWVFGQDISLYQQFNGKIDFTMIGNTLNLLENESSAACEILTSSSSTLNLNTSDYIEAAYLYWAGSGAGDFNVKLNNENIAPERTFNTELGSFTFFSAFSDVTEQIRSTGSGDYTLSELDLTAVIPDYCSNGLNFGGWAIVIIYSNDSLPDNLINVYDGMQSVRPNDVIITLDNLFVVDNTDAKIGFLAWEGDSALAVEETLRFNENVIGNPPLNPYNNAFNSTNSFTGEMDLYNMDLDLYNIEDYISIGDTSAIIELTSGQDFVMINNVVVKLNSQLPDASISLNDYQIIDCNDRSVSVDITVFNLPEATKSLPTNIPISFYAFDGINSVLLETIFTTNEIAVDSSVDITTELIVPDSVLYDFTLIAKVDIDEDGISTIYELLETNNESNLLVSLPVLPILSEVIPLIRCNLGYEKAIFDLEDNTDFIEDSSNISVSYFEGREDAIQNDNEISIPSQYENISNPQKIYVRVTNELTDCYSIAELALEVEFCPPIIPNALVIGTLLEIDTLYTIFTNFEITIFNRYGDVVFRGNDTSKKWDGTYNGNPLPSATYFYSIELHDNHYKSLKGWIYLLK